MSKTVAQIFALNPTTVVADTDLYYLVQSPYTPGTDAAITGADLKIAFGTGGAINPGLINQLGYYAANGSTISGLATLANGTLITSAGGVPSISQTLPTAVQTNITALGTIASGVWNGSIITGTYGGTGVNNGSSLITVGANFTMSGAFAFTGTLTGITSVTYPTSGTLATTSQLPTPAALTKVDDTNVTLTLGGTPATALLQATSLTLGWTGTLSGTRGGTGVNNGANTATFAGNLNFAAAFTTSGAFAVTQTYTGITTVTFPTSGTLATTSQIPTGAALTKTDDTNVTLTLGGSPTTALVNAASLTLGWTGQLGLTRGGTAASLVASNGGIVWSNASQMQILSGTATANQILLSGASATPAWSTTTYPATNAINTIMYASSANVLGVIAAANSGVLVSSSTGVPSMLAAGTTGQMLQASTAGTPAWSTTTYPATNAISTLLYASAANVMSALATANNGLLVTSSTGVPSILAGPGTTGNILQSNAAAAPSFSTATYPSTTTINNILFSSAANVVGQIAAVNGGVLVSNNTGVPSMLANPAAAGKILQSANAAIPTWSTPTYPSASGTSGAVLISDGTNYIASTSLWPNTVGSAGKILRSDGTTNAYTTSTYPNTNAINTLLYASSANVMAALATANSGVLVTDSGGIPSISSTLPAITTSSITFSPTTGGIVGTTAADNAAAGKVGEYMSSSIASGSAVSLVNATAKTITSVTLTAGDWDVWGYIVTSPAGTTTTANCYASISNTTNVTPGLGADTLAVTLYQSSVIAGGQLSIPTGPARINISGSTTYYLVAQVGFAVSTMSAYGYIAARRRR